MQFTRRIDGATVARGTVVDHLHIALAGDRAAVIQAAALGVDFHSLSCSAAADGAAIGQHAIGRKLHLARACANSARIAYPDARFGSNQADLAGVHATQLADVQRELGSRSHRRMRRLHIAATVLACRSSDSVVANDHTQFLGPDSGVDLRCARQDAGVVDQRSVQALAIDRDRATIHAISVQAPTSAHLGRASRQNGPAGIDEAAAIDIDAGRIGDNNLSTLARNLHIALDLAGIGTVDLIEDDARFSAGQPRVPLDPAALSGLHVGAAVVQNGARLVDVELGVGIAAHACSAGRLDIHDRNTVRRGQHRRALSARGSGVCHDLGMRHLAEQGAQGQIETDDAQQGLACYGAWSIAAVLALCTGHFSHCHVLATGLVEDDTVLLLVHDDACPVRRRLHARAGAMNGERRSEGPVQVKASGRAGRHEALRLVDGRADKNVVAQARRPAKAAATQADNGACQRIAQQPSGAGATDAAIVHPGIQFLPGVAQHQAQFVAQQPATLGHQGGLPIKAAHGISATDRETVLRRQRRTVVLPAPAAGVAQVLFAKLERCVQAGIHGPQRKARGAFPERLFGRCFGVECACAALVAQIQVQGCLAEIFAMIECCGPATHTAALHLDFRIVDVIMAAAAERLDGCRRLALRVAVQHAAEEDLHVAAVTAVEVVLRRPGNTLVIAVAAPCASNRPVAERHAVMQDMPASATLAFRSGTASTQITVHRGIEEVVHGQGVVQTDGRAALILAGAVRATVVHRKVETHRAPLLVLQHQVALSKRQRI